MAFTMSSNLFVSCNCGHSECEPNNYERTFRFLYDIQIAWRNSLISLTYVCYLSLHWNEVEQFSKWMLPNKQVFLSTTDATRLVCRYVFSYWFAYCRHSIIFGLHQCQTDHNQSMKCRQMVTRRRYKLRYHKWTSPNFNVCVHVFHADYVCTS